MLFVDQFKKADIDISGSGIVIDETRTSMVGRHYDVRIIENENGTYTITALEPRYDCFLDREYNPQVVEQFEDRHVYTSSWFFGLFLGKKYVQGWSEYKKKNPVTYTTSTITIKKKSI